MAVSLAGGPNRWSVGDPKTRVGGADRSVGREAKAGPAERPFDEGKVRQALVQLDALVGLREVKAVISELVAFAQVQRYRLAIGLKNERVVMHAVFAGSPGTGKTTTARILGGLFAGLGLLARGHLVEVERADLVGEYVGHSAAKARDVVNRAIGGVLFIDEAYSLARGGERDFGKEVTDVLVKAMEDHKNDFVLILAGYGGEMERYLHTNPGLRSRFPLHLDFPNLSVGELLEVAERMVEGREYTLSPAARTRIREMLRAPGASAALACGNARLVRNLLERAMRRQAVRILRSCAPQDEDGDPVFARGKGLGTGDAAERRLLSELLPEDFDRPLQALVGI